jgi:DNA-binding NarL/FixJ family response regulator
MSQDVPCHWVLSARTPQDTGLQLPLTQVTALLQKLGLSGQHAVAEDLLHMVSALVPMAQCTIFAYEGSAPPHIVAIGDRSRTQSLPGIAQAYVSRFYRLDGSVLAMQSELDAARRASAAAPHIVLHRQRGEHIAHADYRQLCYELPQVAERLAILALYDGWRWLSVNFYRGVEHGVFDDHSLQVMEALASLVVQAVRLHYAGRVIDQHLADALMARLMRQHPELTKRDGDVVRALLAGMSTEAMAESLGLELSSAQTYLKRLYRKLGISGQRELLALLLNPEPSAG